MLLAFLLMTILPSMGPFARMSWLDILRTVSALGVLVFWIVVFAIVKVEGKPLLNIQQAAGQGIVWNVLLMVAAGLMLGTAIGNADLGVIVVIKQFLNPILAGKPTLVVVFIIFLVAMLITNFAVNAAMAIALMPSGSSLCRTIRFESGPHCFRRDDDLLYCYDDASSFSVSCTVLWRGKIFYCERNSELCHSD